jgi:predicted methyltransferase
MNTVAFRRQLSSLLVALTLIPAMGFAAGKKAVPAKVAQPETVIAVTSKAALIHLGSLDSFDVTAGGKSAARGVLDFLEKGDRAAAETAIDIYKRITPDENFGGEYTALQWLMECELATKEERDTKFLADPFVRSFRDYLAEENWKHFRAFIRSKYHLDEVPGAKKDPDAETRSRFMEDFILFANPRRESWEKTSKMIAALGLKPGEKVADIGSGPGYFSFQFAKLVGPTGKVFAIDNNTDHLIYLKKTIADLKVPNVVPVMPRGADIGVTEKVDLIYMCSLYHNLYAIMTDEERDGMIDSIKSIMKPGARFVLADNGPVEGNLPYHGPYINRELIIQQFRHLGFDLAGTHQFIPQRYVLVFKLRADAKKPGTKWPDVPKLSIPDGGLIVTDLKKLPATPGISEIVNGDAAKIRVLSHRSLLRAQLPGTSATFSTAGRAAAEVLLDALRKKDAAKFKAARDLYTALIPKERIGDEYAALQWFCDYALADDAARAKMIPNPLLADYAAFFAGDDFKRLTTYLKNKYVLEELKPLLEELGTREADRLKKLGLLTSVTAAETPSNPRTITGTRNVNKGGPTIPSVDATKSEQLDELPAPYPLLPLDITTDTIIEWWEYLVFMNPRRALWEHTDQMLGVLDIKPGQTVADVGSGAGYFTFKFADLVGKTGTVLALDLAKEQLENLNRSAKVAGITNIKTVLSKENNCTLPEDSIDMAFLCSLYHASYVNSLEYVRDGFVSSMRAALKPGGKLVIVDNSPLSDKAGGYYGPRISKEMLIAQISRYGFKFTSYAQFVPQRYVLIFTVEK